MIQLFSLEVEKYCLAGLLQYQEVFPDIDPIVTDADFTNKLNSTIYSFIRQTLRKGEKLDKNIVAQQIKNMGLSFDEEFNPSEYIDALTKIQINEHGTINNFKELVKLRVCRNLSDNLVKAQKEIKSNLNKSISEIVCSVDKITNEKTNLIDVVEPRDLFADLQEMVELRGNNPEEDGVIAPFSIFKSLYGNFYAGDLYFFCARAKGGKSTFLAHVMRDCCNNPNQKVKGLMLDTELETELVQRRLLAALSGVKEYYIRTGFWRHNKEMVDKIRAAWPIVKNYIGSVDHIYIGGKPIDEVIPIIRRWYFKKKALFPDYKIIICYDYIKLSDELSQSNNHIKDYHIVGQKVDKLKRLAMELKCPVLTAGQTNRLNEERQNSKNRVDSGAVVGLSDQINAFSSAVHLFNRCTMDEIAEAQNKFHIRPTHKLIPLYLRHQGENAQGFQDLVRLSDNNGATKWVENFLYFSVENFNVVEIDALSDLVRQHDGRLNIDEGNGELTDETAL